MMKTPLLILTTLIIFGCTHGSVTKTSDVSWDKHINSYEGKSLNTAKRDLGKPETFYNTASGKTYIWRQRTADSPYIKNNRNDWRPSRVTNDVVTSGTRYNTCTIKATTVNDQIIKIWSEGTVGGCAYINNPANRVSTITGLQ